MGTVITCEGVRNKNAVSAPISSEEVIAPSPAFMRTFLKWLQHMAVRMRLAEFKILLSEQHCEQGHYASIEPDFSYRVAQLYLCPEFYRLAPELQRTIIVHEFLHVHMKNLLMPWESLEDILSTDAWNVTASSGIKSEENTVTLLEWIIGPSMPLPPVWLSSRRKPKQDKSKKKK